MLLVRKVPLNIISFWIRAGFFKAKRCSGYTFFSSSFFLCLSFVAHLIFIVFIFVSIFLLRTQRQQQKKSCLQITPLYVCCWLVVVLLFFFSNILFAYILLDFLFELCDWIVLVWLLHAATACRIAIAPVYWCL